jgi:N6-L-threonylcarbamoyladenine synthase
MKIKTSLKKYNVKSFLLGGGVISNQYIQRRIREILKDEVKVYIPEKNLCLDNGVMVAVMSYYLNKYGIPADENRIKVIPTK